MKKFVLFACLTAISASAFGQRESDLKVSITTPSDGATIEATELFNLNVFLTNLGSAHVTTDDTLRYSMTLEGEPVMFPGDVDYLVYQQSIGAGATYTIVRNMAFDSSLDGQTVELCVRVVPMNADDPIIDPEMVDNISCITIHVGEFAGVAENDGPGILIYPNPASQTVSVTSKEPIQTVSVRDALGKEAVVFHSGFDALDCSLLQSGTYFFVVTTESGRKVDRLVINR